MRYSWHSHEYLKVWSYIQLEFQVFIQGASKLRLQYSTYSIIMNETKNQAGVDLRRLLYIYLDAVSFLKPKLLPKMDPSH